MTRRWLVMSTLLSMWTTSLYAQDPTPPQEQDKPAPQAQPNTPSAYDDLVALAEQLYQQRKYDEALQALNQAYKLNPNPNLLYNRARILEESGKLKEALADYEAFAISPGVALEYRRETLERINVLKQTIALKEAKENPKETPKEETKTPPPQEVTPPTQAVAPAPKTSNNAWIWLVGAGAATAAAGGVFGALAWSDQSAMKEATTLANRRSLADSSDQKALIADSLFIAGGALTVIGLIVYAATGDEAPAQPANAKSWRLTPSLGPGQAALELQLSY